ncbi:MAG: NUDIX hydrolase [Anaerolineales bacterium]
MNKMAMDDPLPWRRIKSERGPQIPLFGVRLDCLENPRTREVLQRLVLETPDWVNVVALTPEGRVVMVRQFRFGVGKITTEIPGGIVDPGETSGEAARRELLEETGYTTDDWEYLGAVEANPATQNNLCHHWLARNVIKNGQMNLGDGEDIAVIEMSLAEIKQEIAQGRLLHALALSALARVFDLWH